MVALWAGGLSAAALLLGFALGVRLRRADRDRWREVAEDRGRQIAATFAAAAAVRRRDRDEDDPLDWLCDQPPERFDEEA